MPTFDFSAPDGKSYSVDGPDGSTPEQAFQILQQHLGTAAPAAPQGSTATGIAKSLGVGAGEGAIGLAGLPADLANMFGNARDKYIVNPIAHAIGAPELPVDQPNILDKMGGSAIKSGVEGVTGKFYEPQGRPEQLANTAGQFLPAVLGGPETLLAKLATRVAAPAVASEAAGALTDDNPYAKAAGALTGALAGPMAFNRAVRAMRPGNVEPTVAELKAASRADYKHPDVKDVQFKPEALDDLATKIEKDLQFGPNSGFRAANEPKVFNAVNELRTPLEREIGPAPLGGSAPTALDAANTTLENIFRKSIGDKARAVAPANIDDIDSVRQLLNNVAKERDPTGQLTRQAVAANRAISHIDEFLPNLRQADLLAGDASKAGPILQRARANWGSAKRAENVQTLASNAEINAASANSGANIQNATKQAFKPMLKNNAAKAVGYTDDEIAALNQIVRGTWTGSAARAAGNLLGGGGGLGMLVGGAAGYHEGGVPGAIAVGLAGRGLKMIGNRSTLNAVGRLDRMLRNRSPEAVRIAAQNPQIAMQLPPAGTRRLQAAIAANPVLAAQIGQPVQSNSRQER